MFRNQYIALLITIACIISSLYITCKYYPHYVYNDLKSRVVGTRLATAKLSPYLHKYNPATDSTTLLDPHEKPNEIVNGNTITPTAMLLLQGLHSQQLYIITALWVWLSYAAFFIIIYIAYKQNSHYYIPILMSVLLLTVSWQLHILKGQMYILYTVIAILALYMYKLKRYATSAICAALVTAIRFPYGILFVPLLCMPNNKKWAASYLLGIALLVAISYMYYGSIVWQHYLESMHWHSLENAYAIPTIIPHTYTVPLTMEQVPNIASSTLQAYELRLNPDVFSVQKLLVTLQLPSTTMWLVVYYLLTILILLALLHKYAPSWYKHTPVLLLCSSIALLLADYYLPAVRFNYNYVQILIPLYIIQLYPVTIPKWCKIMLYIGFTLLIIKLNWLPECYSLAEVLCIVSLCGIALQYCKQLYYPVK